MRRHVRICISSGCKKLWNGPWGSFIGGKKGKTHFDLTECPSGK